MSFDYVSAVKVVRVWDTRSGAKTIKLRGHHNNIRALLLDSSGRWDSIVCACAKSIIHSD